MIITKITFSHSQECENVIKMLEDVPNKKFEQNQEVDALKKAILDKDEESVFLVLEKINEILIGEKGTFFLPTWSKEEIRALINSQKANVIIFLGDRAHQSRLIITRIKNMIRLDMGASSTEEVKEKWKKLFHSVS